MSWVPNLNVKLKLPASFKRPRILEGEKEEERPRIPSTSGRCF